MALLAVHGLEKAFSTRVLFENVAFEVDQHDKIGFIGVNGCGKTTLFRLLTGAEAPDGGTIGISRETILGVMEQSVANLTDSLYGAVLSVFTPLLDMEVELERINDELSRSPVQPEALLRRQATLRERYEAKDGLTFRSRTRSTLLGLGFHEDELTKPLSQFSGGQRNKAQLARVLLSGANLLLLDEPTNHLDIQSVSFLEDYLRAFSGAYIVISHDRYFLDRVTNKTMELTNGRVVLTSGNYSRHVELMSTQEEIQRRHYNNTQREIRRIEGIVEQQRRFGRERNFITAESKLKQIQRLKATLVEPERHTEAIRFGFKPREVGGNDVLVAQDLKKSYQEPVFKNVSLHIRRGERVFLLGPNGCGKTTLLKLIMGREIPDEGSFYLGSKVSAGYYEQHMFSLHEENTVLEEIRDEYPTLTDTALRTALAAFLFKGDDVSKEIGLLSGGERARVQLLKLMLAGENLLLLDEPTNHLDIASREALEGALEEYGGTMLIVTHDRYLVNRLADRVLYMETAGLKEYVGGYDEYLTARQEEAAAVPEGTEKPVNDYKLSKQRQNAYNLACGELKRTEEHIARAEEELKAINEKLASPAVASDYVKATELSREADKKQAQIDRLYEEWEAAQAKVESLPKQ